METSITGSGGKGGAGQRPVNLDDTLNSEQTVRVLLAVSEGEIEGISDILLNQISIKNYDARYEVRTGTANQTEILGFIGAIAPISPFSSSPLDKGTPLTTPVPSDAFACRVTLALASLLHVSDKGDRLDYSVDYTIYTRPNAAALWTPYRSFTKSGKATNTYAWDIEVPAPIGVTTSPWEIKIERDTDNDVVAQAATPNHTYFSQITWSVAQALYSNVSESGNKLTYPNTALVAITIRDAEQFGGRVPEITVVAKGMKVRVPSNYDAITHTYTGSWDGSLTEAMYHNTSNPAWHLYNILRNPTYGIGLPSSDIDLNSFYNFAVYADNLVDDGFGGTQWRYEIHNQFIARQDTHTFLGTMLALCHATFGVNEFGQLSLIYDAAGASVKHQATNVSVIDGTFAYSSTPLEDRYTLVNVTFNDRFLLGRTNTATVSDNALIDRFGLQVIDVLLIGCYTEAQALRKARSVLWNSSISTKIVTFKNLFAGITYQPGELINIYDNDNQLDTQAGIVVSGTPGILEIDRTITLGPEVYTVSYLSAIDGSVVEATVLGLVGTTMTITGTVLPADNSTFMLSGDVKPQTYKIIKVSVDGSEHTITAVEHSELKYDYIDNVTENGLLVRPDQDFLPKLDFNSPPISNLEIVEHSTNDGVTARTVLEVSWVAPESSFLPTYKVFWYTEQGEVFTAETKGTPYFEIEVNAPGIYTIAVAAINPFSGAMSSKVSAVYLYKVEEGASWLSPPTDIFVEGTTGTVFSSTDLKVTFNAPAENITSTDSLKEYIVGVMSQDGLSTLAAYTIQPEADLSGRGIFTIDMNRDLFGGVPKRNLTLRFYSRDQGGFLSAAAVVAFTNPAIASPTGALMGDNFDLLLTLDPAVDIQDAVDIIVATGNPGFTPIKDTWQGRYPVGSALAGVKIPVPGIATYYARFALTDVFGDTELNWSGEIPVVVDGGPIQVSIGQASESFLYVSAFTADGVITIGEKAVIRTDWLAQHTVLVNLLDEAAEYTVDTTAYMAAFVAMSTYLNNGVPWVYSSTPSPPYHINDVQQYVEIDLQPGETLSQFRTLIDAMFLAQYAVSADITLFRNNRIKADAYVDKLIDDSVISLYEVTQMRLQWLDLAEEIQGLISFGTPYNTAAEEAAYMDAFNALSTYLNAGVPWVFSVDYPTIPTYIIDNPAFVDIQLAPGEHLDQFRTLLTALFDARLPFRDAIAGGNATDNASILNLITDFDGTNNTNYTALQDVTIAVDGSALSYVANTDGSCDVTFNWNYTAVEPIDGFLLAWRGSTTDSLPHTIQQSDVEASMISIPADQRSFIWRGIPIDAFYTVGIRAYRKVSVKVPEAPQGILISPNLVQPSIASENPYQPSTDVLFGGSIGSVANGSVTADALVADIDTLLVDFNASNNANYTAVAPATIPANAITHTINSDSTASITFGWNWAGTEADIDGFAIFARASTSSAAYVFGTTPAEESVYQVPADNRYITFPTAAADLYYTVGVIAYRKVTPHTTNAPTGELHSVMVQAAGAGENPFRPSADGSTLPAIVTGLAVSQETLQNVSGEVLVESTITWSPLSTNATSYTLAYKNITTNALAEFDYFDTSETSVKVPIVLANQDLVVKVRANFLHNVGPWSADLSFNSGQDLVGPAPTSFTADGGIDYVELTIVKPSERDYDFTEIWYSATNNRALATIIGQTSDTTKTFRDLPKFSGFAWIRHVDTSGNRGNIIPESSPSNFFPASATGGISVATVGVTGDTLINGTPASDVTTSMSVVDSWTDDNIVSYVEWLSIKTGKASIDAEYIEIIAAANKTVVPSGFYTTAYNDLNAIVDPIIAVIMGPGDEQTINGELFSSTVLNYYTERAAIEGAVQSAEVILNGVDKRIVGAVETTNIGINAVVTDRIIDNAVTQLANFYASSFISLTTGFATVGSVSITSTGKPLVIDMSALAHNTCVYRTLVTINSSIPKTITHVPGGSSITLSGDPETVVLDSSATTFKAIDSSTVRNMLQAAYRVEYELLENGILIGNTSPITGDTFSTTLIRTPPPGHVSYALRARADRFTSLTTRKLSPVSITVTELKK